MILVTNDDGYTEGLKILLDAAKSMDKAYAIAPDTPKSAVSKAMTLHKPLRFKERKKDIYLLSGTPSDCVTFGLFCKDFKKPKLVLSGLNWGDNTSLHSLYSSGTLAACIEATLYNIPAIGFSLYKEDHKFREQIKNWGNKSLLKKQVIRIVKLLKNKFPKNTFYSVNFPEKLKSNKIEITEPQKHRFKVKIDKRKDPDGDFYYWITGPKLKKIKGKDLDTVDKGNIIITPITLEPVQKQKLLFLKKVFK